MKSLFLASIVSLISTAFITSCGVKRGPLPPPPATPEESEIVRPSPAPASSASPVPSPTPSVAPVPPPPRIPFTPGIPGQLDPR
jgi:hypothetical protein